MDQNNIYGNESVDSNSSTGSGPVGYNYSSGSGPAGSNPNTGNQGPSNGGDVPGKAAATASLVLGIISIVCWFFGVGSFIGIVTGVVGLICSSNAKKAGFVGGIQTGGFVCSLIGLIGGALVFVACVACVGFIGTIGALSEF